jgi:hypothetical protein
VNGLSKAKARLDRLMLEQLSGGEFQPWVIHDLRRVVRSRLAELRLPEHICEAVIGHGKRGLARIYDQHRYASEIREALEAWNAHLHTIVEPGAADNVVPLRAAAEE